MASTASSMLFDALALGDAGGGSRGPVLPPERAKQQTGNWFETQLALSVVIGFVSFLTFCVARPRSRLLFSPRTMFKDFRAHQVHDTKGYLSWLMPTLKTTEFTVLQIVGLDAVVLLNFFKLGFYYFLTCSVLAFVILVPIHVRELGSTEGVPPEPPHKNGTKHGDGDDAGLYDLGDGLDWQLMLPASLYLVFHLIFLYVFTILALLFLRHTYLRFIAARQLFALELSGSVAARTVLMERLPPHLKNDKALASYWQESCHLPVESVSVVRDVGELGTLLRKRTDALFALENAWRKWLGNPVKTTELPNYDPDAETRRILYGAGDVAPGDRDDEAQGMRRADRKTNGSAERPAADTVEEAEEGAAEAAAAAEQSVDEESASLIAATPLLSHPTKARPTMLVSWWNPFSERVDALEHLASQFREKDDAVRRRRRGRFRTTDQAFVTFESLAAAQVAAQVVHNPTPGLGKVSLAPEPRDIHWTNIALSPWSAWVRNVVVIVLMVLLLLFWTFPVIVLSRLLSYDAIKSALPPLARAIESNRTIEALVQNSLPSLGLIMFNALLPFFLDWLSVFQGTKARTWIELSLLKKYHLLLLITVFFVFLASYTITLLQDLRDNPGRIVDKLARSLPGVRNFFTSYVMLQGIAIMPLQLVQLAVLLPRVAYRAAWTRTPREFAELNAPPVLSLGTVYPQAILIFNVCMIYSIISPIILIFGTLYFGMAYLVYKYKLLFIYYRPFESRGQAWPATCNRIGWGLIIFQLFMSGLFSLRRAILLSTLTAPLILYTIYALRRLDQDFKGHVTFVNLSQACAVEGGDPGADGDVERLRRGHPVTKSQRNLNVRRYEARDSSLYIVGHDEHTEYSQPPMSEVFVGVLDTGRKRYAHPAIFGQMPEPQLPILKRMPHLDPEIFEGGAVVDLRRRWSDAKALGAKLRRLGRRKQAISLEDGPDEGDSAGASAPGIDDQDAIAARDITGAEERETAEGEAEGHRLLGAKAEDEDEEDEDDATSGRTFYPKRKGRRVSLLVPERPSSDEGEQPPK